MNRSAYHLAPGALALLLTTSCSVGRNTVALDELPAAPTLTLRADTLLIAVDNSIVNSALTVQGIQVRVDPQQRQVYLSAHESVRRKRPAVFAVDLRRYQVVDPAAYEFYWLNPDQQKTKLVVQRN